MMEDKVHVTQTTSRGKTATKEATKCAVSVEDKKPTCYAKSQFTHPVNEIRYLDKNVQREEGVMDLN